MTDREAVRKAQAEYQKQYRKKNPEKVKAAQERYWLKRAQKIMGESEGAQLATMANNAAEQRERRKKKKLSQEQSLEQQNVVPTRSPYASGLLSSSKTKDIDKEKDIRQKRKDVPSPPVTQEEIEDQRDIYNRRCCYNTQQDKTDTIVSDDGGVRGYLDGDEAWFRTIFDVQDFVKQLEERYAD